MSYQELEKKLLAQRAYIEKVEARNLELLEENKGLERERDELKDETNHLTQIILLLKPKFEEIKGMNKVSRFFRIGALAWKLTLMFFDALNNSEVIKTDK